ncbi:ankyrin-1-like [Elysia marginata]|uniref:Ankyrin-1-like n=1 Tax=Elysia marginata TaxID=1093978 RepID=A0AAV4JWY5_9GAST|nr:ankyrin-1-like [Elysia marginata]
MSMHHAEERWLGSKKMAVVSDNVVENIRDHEVSRCFALSEWDRCYAILFNYCVSGGILYVRDMHTKESFLHILADYTHLYLSATSCRIFYALCIKLDMDYTDINGDTALHKVVRVPGAWRPIVALMRCGANPLIKNKAGRTPEEEILHLKYTGYEENLHWLRKFLPGLWAAVLSRHPDLNLVERLLRYWCRTTKMEGREIHNLKCALHMTNAPLDFVCIVEKYENTNEMALTMLSGKSFTIDHWKRTKEAVSSLDVNTKDHSYQFHYREYPTAPRPLLAAVWELDDFEMINAFMQLDPDTSIKYTFESEASSPPKPLFFQLVNPKSRPQNEAITAHVLSFADLNMRTREGRTILMEAMYTGETEGVIRTILNAGVNLAARDGLGRTARDHAVILKRPDYVQLIDSRVTELIYAGEASKLWALFAQLYPYVKSNISRRTILNDLLRHQVTKEVVETLKQGCHSQITFVKLFSLAKSGNKTQFVKLITQNYGICRDKAGRTFLHVCVQHSLSSHRKNLEDTVLFHNTQNQRNDSVMQSLEISHSAADSELGSDEIHLLSETDSRIINNTESSLDTCKKRPCQRICKFVKKRSWRPNLFSCSDFEPDHLGIAAYLVDKFPDLVDMQNSFGQTPLHYAYIYSAPKEIFDILKRPGSQQNVKDVTFDVRRKPTVEIDLEIFLEETNFKENFCKAITKGSSEAVKKLALPLLELDGQHRFSNVLFDCLDIGHFDIAWYLVDAGFPWDISKQYETCNPDNPMCAMMECSHAVTTLHKRAIDTGAVDLANLIKQKQNPVIAEDMDKIG